MTEKGKEAVKGVGYTISAVLMIGIGAAATVVEGPIGTFANRLGRKSPMAGQIESASLMWENAKSCFEKAGNE